MPRHSKDSEELGDKLHLYRRWQDIHHIWVLDAEFQTVNGRPVPVCLCAVDILTSDAVEMFFRDAEPAENPFRDYERSVFIGHSLAAEWGVFITLGWKLPPNCIDTMFEFACLTNQKMMRDLVTPSANSRSLLDACEYFGIDTMGCSAKTNERENIILNGRVAPPGIEQADHEGRIISYCWQDVYVTRLLFERIVKLLDSDQAMLRGEYSRAVAWYQHNGLPLNLPWIKKVIKYRDQIKLHLMQQIEQKHQYGAYRVEGGEAKFDEAGAGEMVERMGLAKQWKRSEKTGRFSFEKNEVEAFAKMYPELLPFYELRKTDAALKNFTLNVDSDGCNRTFVAPFGQKSGRNNPGGGFILAGPKWLRYGIQAPPGHVLIACDVRSEEFVLAAAFAQDRAELESYHSGRDLYMDRAIRLGVVPPGADHKKEPDPEKRKRYAAERKKFKTVSLGIQYGQGPKALAAKLGISNLDAQIIVADLKRVQKRYWDWSDSQIALARKRGYIETALGWRMYVYPQVRRGPITIGTRSTTLVNWPIQAAGAEILRLASIYLERAGYGPYLCAPHHDAIYACAPTLKAKQVAAAIEAAFITAGDIVMDGKGKLLVDTGFYPGPHAYEDEDGADLFVIVDEFLATLPEVADEEWNALQAEMREKIEASRRKKRGDKKLVV